MGVCVARNRAQLPPDTRRLAVLPDALVVSTCASASFYQAPTGQKKTPEQSRFKHSNSSLRT